MSLRLAMMGLLAMLVVGSGLAQTPSQPISKTYILSQAICLSPSPDPPVPLKSGCAPQTVPFRSIVEIQLPGGPSVWEQSFLTLGLVQIDAQVLDSPGRIEGTNKIYRFRYLLTTRGVARVSFKESPPFLSKPGGEFDYVILAER